MIRPSKFTAVIVFLEFFIYSAAQLSYSQYAEERGGGGSNIPLGLFTDQSHEETGIIFDHAIDVANENIEARLSSYKEEVNYGDSFQAYNKLCSMLKMGVGAIFGPSSKHTAAHLMTVCDTKDIPYINSQMSPNPEGFNLHPHPDDLAKALHSIINAFMWTRFIFLYESAEYLPILTSLTSLFENPAPVISVLRYDIDLSGNYKDVFRRVRKASETQIVVVGSTDSMQEFLKQAQQVGILNEDYKYIIGNLDFHALDLEEYKFSESNITSIRMFSTDQKEVRDILLKLHDSYKEEDFRNGSCGFTVEMALMYDAVQVFAETTKYVDFRSAPLTCSDKGDSVNEDGSTFKNYMRSLTTTKNTITGDIFFEGNVRKGYSFDVIELQPSGILKVGTWDEQRNFTSLRLAPTQSVVDIQDNSLANKTFRVLVAVPNPPYTTIVQTQEKRVGNAKYEGFAVDLIQELADKLGFDYIFIETDLEYGGMLAKIVAGQAELGIADLTITAEREQLVDFSNPFMNLGIGILYKRPMPGATSLFQFMNPFHMEVWILVGFSFIGVSLSFFFLGRLSPNEWDNPYPCVEEPEELENQFTLGNSIWFTAGALLQQGSDIGPKAVSVRIVGITWLFFTLIVISTYTANLAAFLTMENPTSLINSVDDLAENKGGVQFGSKRTGSTRKFFEISTEPKYKKMNEFMNSHPECLTKDNDEGAKKVSAHYAFLMESSSIEYQISHNCDVTKIGMPLDEKGYGIAMPKNWPYRPNFNGALMQLQEQGVLASLKNKWWNEVGEGICPTGAAQPDAKPLGMKNLLGVFFVLVMGSILALVQGIVNWTLFVVKKAKFYNVPFKEAFLEEFKIVVNFDAYTRELKTTQSVYSRSRNSSASIESLQHDTKSSQNS